MVSSGAMCRYRSSTSRMFRPGASEVNGLCRQLVAEGQSNKEGCIGGQDGAVIS